MFEPSILICEKNGEKIVWFTMFPKRVLKDLDNCKLLKKQKVSENDIIELRDYPAEFLSKITGEKIHIIDYWESPMGFECGEKLGVKTKVVLFKEIGELQCVELYGYTHILIKGEIIDKIIKAYETNDDLKQKS